MKKSGFAVKGLVAISVLSVLSAAGYGFLRIGNEEASRRLKVQNQVEEQENLYTSGVSAEDCRLCRNNPCLELDEDNLGMIFMSSGKLVCVEINRYDEAGQQIEKPAGFMSTDTIEIEGCFKASLMVNPDRGYARAKITLQADRKSDMDKSTEYFCSNCLNRLLKDADLNEAYGVGLIHFKTREVKLLDTHIRGFMLGDYYVSCKAYADEGEGNIAEIEILIFYCPERFK